MRGNDFVKPLGMRVLIRKDESRNQTRGGIVLPDQAEIPTITGRVVEVSLQIERDAMVGPIPGNNDNSVGGALFISRLKRIVRSGGCKKSTSRCLENVSHMVRVANPITVRLLSAFCSCGEGGGS